MKKNYYLIIVLNLLFTCYFAASQNNSIVIYKKDNSTKSIQIDAINKMEFVFKQNMQIPFKQGWNLVSSYIVPEMDTLTVVTADLNPNLVIIKRADGKIYMPGGINQIGNQLPGEGYQAYLNAKDTLIYPANSAGRTSNNNNVQDYDARNIKLDYEFTGNNASLILDVDAIDNSEIAVMNNENKIVGAGRVVDGRTVIAIWGNDEISNYELRIMNYEL